MKLFEHQKEGINIGRQVPRFPGYYVTREGDVYSLRLSSLKRNNNNPLKLQLITNFEGYLVVTLYRNKKRHQGKVHRLVMTAFNPVANMDNLIIRHLNGDKTDNSIENLAWGKPSQNSMDMVRHGHSLRGSRNHSAKITASMVKVIRNKLSLGQTQQSIALQFGISKGHVSNIGARRVWQHV